MKLQHITFTGIDAKTDIRDLIEIQREYPIAEFGVLTSYHWYENGNRYLDPALVKNMRGQDLHLALHICGSMAHDAADGYWDKVDNHMFNVLGLFKRIQLNVANRTDNPYRLASTPNNQTEVILQQKGIHDVEMFEHSKWMDVSVLLDASGGQGIDTPIEVLPNVGKLFKVGYAGGINPSNVADKLSYLFQHEELGEFWIDMESGVRTDDWFDIDKVYNVLRTCKPIIEKYV